jgi:hypothetical protein
MTPMLRRYATVAVYGWLAGLLYLSYVEWRYPRTPRGMAHYCAYGADGEVGVRLTTRSRPENIAQYSATWWRCN